MNDRVFKLHIFIYSIRHYIIMEQNYYCPICRKPTVITATLGHKVKCYCEDCSIEFHIVKTNRSIEL